MKRFIAIMMMCLTMSGCAGFERGCSSTMATSFGSDWAVVELTEQRGTPYRCWTLEGVSVANEEMSDGIYWKTRKGHLVHISGSYDYVQVKNGERRIVHDVTNRNNDKDKHRGLHVSAATAATTKQKKSGCANQESREKEIKNTGSDKNGHGLSP